MNQSLTLKIVLACSLAAIILFPLYTIFIQHPAVKRLLAENAITETVHLATRISTILLNNQQELQHGVLPADIVQQMKELEKDARFMKLLIYSTSGEIMYSTDPLEIGAVNKEKYLQEVITTGESHAQEVGRNKASMERTIMHSDVVETYVPIMIENRVAGVFEIYYDISKENQKLQALLNRTLAGLFIMALILLAGVVFSAFEAGKSLAAQKKIEEEREELIGELQTALAKVKTLSGLLPICSSCKKIRDDNGYWNQIETYISDHTDADFTHSICPECKYKLYPVLKKKISA